MKTAKEVKPILIDNILTTQAIIRKNRLEDFKKFIKLSKNPDADISPVEVMEFPEQFSEEKYLLIDGNHRLRARYELNMNYIVAIVVDNKNTPFEGLCGHHIKDNQIIESKNSKEDTWKPKKSFFS